MKAPHVLLAVAATFTATSSLLAFAEFARGEAKLSTTARATYDSRVFGGVNGADDYIFSLEPLLIYRREAGQIRLESELGTRINRYLDFTELNSEDFVGSLRLRLPPEEGRRFSGTFLVSYDERTDVNYDVNTRVRQKNFLTSANALIPTGLKTSVVLGGSFRNDQRNQFSDRESWDGYAGFRYGNFLGGAMMELTYRHTDLESSGGNAWGIPLDQQSDTYSITFSRPIYNDFRGSLSYGYRILNRSRSEVFGRSDRSEGSIVTLRVDGPFLPESMFPKVETSFAIGYQKAESPGINDTGGERFVGSAHVTWHARERTDVFLDLRRSLELSINDLTVETSAVEIGVSQKIGAFIDANASIGREQRDYRTAGRKDHATIASAGLAYRINPAWSAHAQYRLRDSSSSWSNADYSRHVAYVSVNYIF
ncbi:MAG TPA: outer membrane beta-barrel protein [Opitutus sp.]|nr:outer membrane beta-barrel protein [Opitutus sp.]